MRRRAAGVVLECIGVLIRIGVELGCMRGAGRCVIGVRMRQD